MNHKAETSGVRDIGDQDRRLISSLALGILGIGDSNRGGIQLEADWSVGWGRCIVLHRYLHKTTRQ